MACVADIPGICAVQCAVYADFLLEEAGFFRNRILLANHLCWIATDSQGSPLGYLISYPWVANNPPKLNIALDAIPDGADHWFIHDCAVLPGQQGQGIARRLLQAAGEAALGAGLQRAALVSLGEAVGYWQRQGFVAVDVAPGVLAGYGDGACYMFADMPAVENNISENF